MKSSITAMRRRGPAPSITSLESFIILLLLYKHGWDYFTLAYQVKQPKRTVVSAISRILPILHSTLRSRWWENRERPRIYHVVHPHIVLCVDTISMEVQRPKAPFNEAKVYWDGKNHIYALKKEVAVRTMPPHYALFSQKAFVGSHHDYHIFKLTANSYGDYLQKTPE